MKSEVCIIKNLFSGIFLLAMLLGCSYSHEATDSGSPLERDAGYCSSLKQRTHGGSGLRRSDRTSADQIQYDNHNCADVLGNY